LTGRDRYGRTVSDVDFLCGAQAFVVLGLGGQPLVLGGRGEGRRVHGLFGEERTSRFGLGRSRQKLPQLAEPRLVVAPALDRAAVDRLTRLPEACRLHRIGVALG
jgi:hypothetical protein